MLRRGMSPWQWPLRNSRSRPIFFRSQGWLSSLLVIYAVLPVEVPPAHTSGICQGLRLQRQVPLTPGDGDCPLQGLFSAFIVTFRNAKDLTVAREEAPRLVGIGRDQSESTSNNLSDPDPWNLKNSGREWELRGGHRQGDIPGLGIVLEGAA